MAFTKDLRWSPSQNEFFVRPMPAPLELDESRLVVKEPINIGYIDPPFVPPVIESVSVPDISHFVVSNKPTPLELDDVISFDDGLYETINDFVVRPMPAPLELDLVAAEAPVITHGIRDDFEVAPMPAPLELDEQNSGTGKVAFSDVVSFDDSLDIAIADFVVLTMPASSEIQPVEVKAPINIGYIGLPPPPPVIDITDGELF